MTAMFGWSPRFAVFVGVLVGLCLCSPLYAGQNASPRQAGQSQASAPVHDAEAVATFRRAAEEGNPAAQYLLADMYHQGRSVPRDDAEAVRWYRRAADQGVADAQFSLGLMYEKGQSVPQDDSEAVRFYRLAAEQGLSRSQANLGIMHAQGRGVPQDYVAAHMWLNLATAQAPTRDRDKYVEARDLTARLMTPEQIAEAQRLAREWTPTLAVR